MKIKKKLLLLFCLVLIVSALYLFLGLNPKNWEFALGLRIPKLLAILLTGSAIAFSSTIFQTITNNRILTPSVLGLNSLYLFIQTFVVFVFGSSNLAKLGGEFDFLLSVGAMLLFSLLLFQILFRKEGRSIYFILLLGMVFGTFFESLSSFMQVLIDPNEFLVVQNSMFASFNNINTDILGLALIITLLTFILTLKYLRSLDVLSLGRENAISLGLNYDKVVRRMLMVISILVSVSTALVGPITFLGLLVVNLSRELFSTYQHKYLVVSSIFISILTLVGGQLLAERVLNFSTPISVIINFVGGIYFIYLLLKESKL